MFRPVLSSLADFLFPKELRILELESLSPAELISKLPNALDLGEDTIALWNYADQSVRDLVWELKYRKNPKVARTLATILYDVLKQEVAERALFENFTNPLLIPMPMSDKRRAERGWNQTELLCEEIKKLDKEDLFTYEPSLLIKLKHTESQTKTDNKKTRLSNIENSMSVAGPELARGRNIILLDDVTTTGATLKEARRALRLAGARRILAIALAH